MSTVQRLHEEIELLPASVQEELEKIVHELREKYSTSDAETLQWSGFSLNAALQGMEDDSIYTVQNIKEQW